MFAAIIAKSLFIVILFSAIPLAATALVGLIISIIQAATQIQEQTVLYAAKFATVCLLIVVLGEWLSAELLRYCEELLSSIGQLGRS